jgi:transposase
MSKPFRPYAPRQGFLLPPSPLEWLPEDHLAYFILDVVAGLELGEIFAYYEREGRGQPPHHPGMMVGLLLYAYCVGVPSSRKIEKRTHEDVAFRVIAGNTQPDHTCISEFRRIHLEALAKLFVQVLWLCQAAGLVKLGHVALDGSKVKANASKHKAMSYKRMKEEEDRLREKVAELLRAAEEADAAEDAAYGPGRRGDELPEELRRAESRRERIRQLRAELEAEARAQKEAAEKGSDDESPPGGPTPLPSHRIPTTADGTPTDKAQRNFTDAESRIQKTGDGYVQGYNCQAAVDAEHQVVVAQAVTNQPPDVEHLVPMVERVIDHCRSAPSCLTADAGYFSESNVVALACGGIDAYIATERRKHRETPPPERGAPGEDLTVRAWMARRLATEEGRKIYARRKVIVEPAFGQIKNRGFRQFLLRGLAKVRGEWALITTAHNLLKLHGTPRPA